MAAYSPIRMLFASIDAITTDSVAGPVVLATAWKHYSSTGRPGLEVSWSLTSELADHCRRLQAGLFDRSAEMQQGVATDVSVTNNAYVPSTGAVAALAVLAEWPLFTPDLIPTPTGTMPGSARMTVWRNWKVLTMAVEIGHEIGLFTMAGNMVGTVVTDLVARCHTALTVSLPGSTFTIPGLPLDIGLGRLDFRPGLDDIATLRREIDTAGTDYTDAQVAGFIDRLDQCQARWPSGSRDPTDRLARMDLYVSSCRLYGTLVMRLFDEAIATGSFVFDLDGYIDRLLLSACQLADLITDLATDSTIVYMPIRLLVDLLAAVIEHVLAPLDSSVWPIWHSCADVVAALDGAATRLLSVWINPPAPVRLFVAGVHTSVTRDRPTLTPISLVDESTFDMLLGDGNVSAVAFDGAMAALTRIPLD